uniref:Uncharacterized protein n=1 Tax=Syphacia muris TaxID=451379 RepID=A0A0N5ACM6_9BILA
MEEIRSAFKAHLSRCKIYLEEITEATTSIDEKNTQLLKEIASLTDGKKKQEEEAAYDKNLAGESGIFCTLKQGKSTIAILRVEIQDAKDSIASLFDGQPEENFLGLLRTKIDQTKMDPADKFARLMQALTGFAKGLVREFAITRENYPVVLAKLRDEYSNLAKIRLNLLRELPVIRRETDIISVLDEIELILQQLMSVEANLCDETVQEYLEDAIIKKLSPWLMSQIHLRRDMAKDWNLSHLRKALQQIMWSRKDFKIPPVLKIEKASESKVEKSNTKCEDKVQSTVYAITESKQSFKKPPKSEHERLPKTRRIFCEENHFNDACTKYRTLD